MERPYLSKGVRGNTRNLFDKVRDYSEKSQPTNLDDFNDALESISNEKMYINNSNFISKMPILQHEKEL